MVIHNTTSHDYASRTVLPKYHQHVSFPTRENNILDQVYSNVKGGYKAEETDLVLQDCFDTTDWEVFRTAAVREDCTVDLEDYDSGVTSYISTCTETIVPTKRSRTYPN
ncbi:hypothetical protein NFI96_000083 [Prochilodus magdalenae]|nr:hypothetical protein NFI96_000083 [Prochilodus magdalenae]